MAFSHLGEELEKGGGGGGEEERKVIWGGVRKKNLSEGQTVRQEGKNPHDAKPRQGKQS